MTSHFADFPLEGVQLEAFRSILKLAGSDLRLELVRFGQGFAIFFTSNSRRGGFFRGYLMAERSKQLRVFAKAETAFKLLESVGLKAVTVNLQDRQSEFEQQTAAP